MHAGLTSAQRTLRLDWRLLAVAIALAGCTSGAQTSSADTSANAPPVAAENAGGGTHSVTAVSQVLGQRLDGMLNAGQSGAGAAR